MLDNLKTHSENINKQTEFFVNEFTRKQNEVNSEIQKEIQKSLSTNVDYMNKSINALDQSMQAELNNSLKIMGSKLTAITEAFINNYGKFIENHKNFSDSYEEHLKNLTVIIQEFQNDK